MRWSNAVAAEPCTGTAHMMQCAGPVSRERLQMYQSMQAHMCVLVLVGAVHRAAD
jgi:hypothetical protein